MNTSLFRMLQLSRSLLLASSYLCFTSVELEAANPSIPAQQKASTKSSAKPTADEQPASVETAAGILDLRTLPLPEETETFSTPEVGALSYKIKSEPESAFKFQQQQLLQQGWKELPGTSTTAQYANGMFSKAGYTLVVTAFPAGEAGGEPKCLVSLANLGNVNLKTLPVVKEAKPAFINEATAMYATSEAVPEVTQRTQQLFMDAGWEPYGFIDAAPDTRQFAVKRNAIRIFIMVSVASGQNNATSIMYSSTLLAADISAPPDAEEVQFNGATKTLLFRSLQDYEAVAKFYQETLPRKGWKPATETLVTSLDQFDRPIAFQVYRNPAGDMLTLDLEKVEDKTVAKMVHLSKAEYEEADKRAREAALASVAKDKAAKDKQDMKNDNEEEMDIDVLADAALAEALKGVNGNKGGRKSKKDSKDGVSLKIPAGANPKQTSDNVVQIKVEAGKGMAAATLIVDQLKKAGWEVEEEDMDETMGNLQLKKGSATVTLTFVDSGFADVNMMVIGIGTPVTIAEDNDGSKTDGSKKPGTRKSPASQK